MAVFPYCFEAQMIYGSGARHSLRHRIHSLNNEVRLWAAASIHFGVRRALFSLPDVLHPTVGLDARETNVRTASLLL